MNTITIKGRLVRDPELRHTQSDTAVASFNVAVDRRFTPQGQEKQADFIDCVAWRGLGEMIARYFSKGKEIVVRGALQSRKWEDKDGNKRISWEIVADEVDFCGPKQQESDSKEPPYPSATGADISASDFEELSDADGDLPF